MPPRPKIPNSNISCHQLFRVVLPQRGGMLKWHAAKRAPTEADAKAIGRWKKRNLVWSLLKPKMLALLQQTFGSDLQAAAAFLSIPRPQLGGKSFKQAFGPYRARFVYELLSAELSRYRTAQEKKDAPGAS